tara:strand:+ start:301 stop:963 length:663 start_codon:yes stop_codon:yes gene_type:complete
MGFIGKQPTPVPLTASDIPDLPATKITSGTFPALNGSNLTSLPAGNLTGTLPAISGANLTGISAGNYSVHAIASYGETTYYDFTSSAHPVTISDESCTLTPTSTSDIFYASGSVTAYSNNASTGFGILVKKDTASDFSNTTSDNWLYQSGRYADHSQSSNFYGHQSFAFHFTLGSTSQHYFRIYGMVQSGGGTMRFNNDAYATTETARHWLQVIQYKYEG